MIDADKFIQEQAEKIQFGEVAIVAKIRAGVVYRVEKTMTVFQNTPRASNDKLSRS